MELTPGQARAALLDFGERTVDDLLKTTNVFFRSHPETERYERAMVLARAAGLLASDEVAFLLAVAVLRLADDGGKRG